jgi:hypothetical protein
MITCEPYCNGQETPAEKRAREQLERTRAKEAERRETARDKLVAKVGSKCQPPRDSAAKLLKSADQLPPMVVSNLEQHIETLDGFLADSDPDVQDRCANMSGNACMPT